MTSKAITTFRVAGVPEHFNFPWHLIREQKYLEDHDLKIVWQDIKSGTGTLTKMLDAKEIDLAVLLTEGILANIANGGEHKIVQVFVKSPLNWGIHVPANSKIHHKHALKGKRYAISRFGSGSHIMAYVLSSELAYEIKTEDFVIVNDMDGAVKALSNGEADVFLWEKYMTMPWVEKGIFRRIGEIPTPWPGFVIAARNEVCEKFQKELQLLLNLIRTVSVDLMTNPDNFEYIANRFNLKKDKIYEWMQLTEWENSDQISKSMISDTLNTLYKVGLIKNKPFPEQCCAGWCKLI